MKKIYLFLMACLVASVGFAQSVEMVINANDSTDASAIKYLNSLDGKLIYRANGKSYGYWSKMGDSYRWNTRWENEVWMSDGTEAGTSMIEINPTTKEKTDAQENTYVEYQSAGLISPVIYNGELYFKASDGTAFGTYKMDVNGNYQRVVDWTMAYTPIVDNDTIYYCTSDYRDGEGRSIIAWDGDAASEPDTLPYQKGNYNTNGIFCKLGNKFIVTANAVNDDPDVGTEVFLYDPTNTAGPQLLLDIDTVAGKNGSPKNFKHIGDKVYFQASKGTWPNARVFAYETDGTPEGTKEVTAITEAIDSLYLDVLGEFDGKLLFAATHLGPDVFSYGNNAQLFSYNPADQSVTQLSDETNHKPMSMFVNTNNVLNGWMYYGANAITEATPYGDRYLFRTNGTVVEKLDTVVSAVSDLAICNGKVYFEGRMPDASVLSDGTLATSGDELMVYDPTSTSVAPAFSAANEITVSPNPSNGIVNVTGLSDEFIPYDLYDLSGRSLERGNVVNGQINYNVKSGVYILRIVDGSNTKVVKIMVK